MLLGGMWIYAAKIHTFTMFSHDAVTGAKSVRSSSYREIRPFPNECILGLPGYCLLTERMESGPKFSLVLLLGARIAAHPIHRLPNLQGMRQTKRAPKWLPLPTQVWQQRMKRKDENRIVRIKRKTGGIIFQQD
jgi:hypothetical protein